MLGGPVIPDKCLLCLECCQADLELVAQEFERIKDTYESRDQAAITLRVQVLKDPQTVQ